MTRCAKATGAGQRSFGAGSCAQRVMPKPITASHLLPQREGGSEAAGYPPAYSSRVQTAGCAITSDLVSVVCSPSRMASSYISNVPARGRPMGSPLLRSDPFALSEVRL
jgi:hypothetical protein